MKYIVKIFICMNICLFLTGCGKKEMVQSQMPEIVFEYHVVRYEYDDEYGEYVLEAWYIDNKGNVYYSQSLEDYWSYEEMQKKYEYIKEDPTSQIIKTIDISVLQEKFDMMKQILEDGKCEVIEEETYFDMEMDDRNWFGYYYDQDGNAQMLHLHGDGYYICTNQDQRTRDIANWISEVIGQQGLPSYVYNDNSSNLDETNDGESTSDVGESYFKEPTEEEIATNHDTGISYVKNQLLISALPETPMSEIKILSEEIGAQIVGYIELTNDYQIEFLEDKTYEELEKMAEYIKDLDYISDVTLNTVVAIELD